MKTINRLFAAALVLFVAAACYNKEIESPDNRQDPETQDISEQTGLKITASIIQTRVTYTDGTTTLNQQWEKGENGDIVFGFIDDANHTPVVLQVDDINNGVATLVPTIGEEALSAMNENTYVNLIYTGGSPQSLVASDETYSYSIDMTDQDGKIPACMHARARKEGNAIEFDFVNDCAILEIVGITGVTETVGTWTNKKLSLESVTVSGVNTSLSYTYANGGTGYALPELMASNANGSSITISPETGSLYLDNNGNIVDNAGNSARILMAVPANTSPMEITVRAEGFGSSYALSSGLSNSTCYVVKAQDVVAKTEDGLYFKTVTGAFDHARTIKNSYITAETNIVTLVRNCGLAGINSDGTSKVGDSSPLLINGYDVTLDLNGHVLTLAGDELFVVNGVYDDDEEVDDYVQKSQTLLNTFIINDSKEKNADDVYDGKIMSSSGNNIVRNLGKINVKGGTLHHKEDWSVVKNYGSGKLTITDGDFCSDKYYTINNEGTAIINNGTFSAGDFVDDGDEAVIFNSGTGTLTVNCGTVEGENVNAIFNYNNLNITGGKISSENNYAVYAKGGEVHISQGEGVPCVISTKTEIALILYSSAVGTISGGTITSSGKCAVSMNQKSSLTVSGGIISCTGPATGLDEISASAIQCRANNVGDSPTLTVTWPEGGYTASTYEPLLYSKSDTPIAEMSAKIPGDPDFYSTVTIKGGCLYTGVNGGAFFRQDEVTYTPLQYENADFFYTNISSLPESISYVSITSTSVESKQIESNHHNIPKVGTLYFDSWIKIVNR